MTPVDAALIAAGRRIDIAKPVKRTSPKRRGKTFNVYDGRDWRADALRSTTKASLQRATGIKI
jgi:hypothetical protein